MEKAMKKVLDTAAAEQVVGGSGREGSTGVKG